MKNNDLKLYAMYDRKSGQYSQPFLQTNERTASRYFEYMCKLPENRMVAEDLELYFLATYDVGTGIIVPVDKPIFLINAGEIIHEVIKNEE